MIEEERPAPYILPPPDHWSTTELPFPDPLLDRPCAALPGLFFNVEPNALWTHFRNQLQIPIAVTPTRTDTLAFFGPKLNPTVSPRFEIGCRLEDGWGSLLVGYRFLTTQGSSQEAADTAGSAQNSGRLALNSFDFGYASQEFSLGPALDMRWRTGLRSTIVYYDARLSFNDRDTGPGSLLEQREINYFWGVGPWLGLDLARNTTIPGLAIFARVEGALQFGHITQTGTELFGGNSQDATRLVQGQSSFEVTVLQLAEEIGLSYTVPCWNHSRFLLGYHYETWFQVGRLNSSRGQIDTQGVFLRAELNF
jgi:hypothetical protein